MPQLKPARTAISHRLSLFLDKESDLEQGTELTDYRALSHLADHANGIMLIFARTETKAWQRDVFPLADATLFLDGRVRFCLPSGERGKSGTAPSALLAYGQNNVDALRNAGIGGAFFPKAEILTGIKGSQL